MTMRCRLGQIGCFLLLLLLSGCKGMFGAQGLPSDPLFANRKVTESKAVAEPPVDTAYREPTPPVKLFVIRPR